MNRRNFLSLFSAGVAGIALEQAIPLGRVWSFPKEIVIPPLPLWNLRDDFESEFRKSFTIGSIMQIRMPERFIIRRMIDKHLYEIVPDPPPIPYKITSSYVATAAFPPDSSHRPS